jgi:hypothetical protein
MIMSPAKFLAIVITVISILAVISASLTALYVTPANIEGGAAYTIDNSNGLRLSVAWSTISVGNPSIQLNVEVFNTRSSTNNVSTTDLWPLLSLSSGPCDGWAAGIALYYGHYNRFNVASATPLDWYEPGAYLCPLEFHIYAYIFHPFSDLANTYPGYGYSVVMMRPFFINQTWSGTMFKSTPQPLHSGQYTLVAGDCWGQELIVNFNIV